MKNKVEILCITHKNAVRGDFFTRLELLLQGGLWALVLREKDLVANDFRTLAFRVHQLCVRYNTPLFLNANFADFAQCTVPLAYELSCGVHTSFENYKQVIQEINQKNNPKNTQNVSQNSSQNIRQHVSQNIRQNIRQKNNQNLSQNASQVVQEKTSSPLGISIHSMEEAEFIRANFSKIPLTHVIVGHIFDTNCKQGTAGRGLQFLERITKHLRDIPQLKVFAIGGMTPSKVCDVLNTGAQGLAVMSSLMETENPKDLLADFHGAVA